MKKKSFKLQADTFLLILMLLVSSILLGFSGGEFLLDVKTIGFNVASSAGSALHSTVSFVKNTVSAMRELSELKVKYEELSKQLEQYEILQRSNADIKNENIYLRNLLNFSEHISVKNISAQIIGYDFNKQYSGIIIGRGSKDGIKKNMPVIAFQDGAVGLVGKVIQVGHMSSMILPVYDYQFYVAGKMEIKQHRGIVQGQGGLDLPLLMKYVRKSASASIEVGDKIVTSGFDTASIFPKDIPIGFVREVQDYTYATSLDVLIDPILDFDRLEDVFVLTMEYPEREF